MTLGRLFLGFMLFAVLEVMAMSAVADLVGWPLTLVLLIATGIIGSALLRHQGLETWTRLNQRMQAGELPSQELVEGVMLLIGSVCLITPGFITDSIGFVLLIAPSRRWLAARLIAKGQLHAFSQFQPGGFGPTGAGPSFYRSGNVYEGEVSPERRSANDQSARVIELHDADDEPEPPR